MGVGASEDRAYFKNKMIMVQPPVAIELVAPWDPPPCSCHPAVPFSSTASWTRNLNTERGGFSWYDVIYSTSKSAGKTTHQQNHWFLNFWQPISHDCAVVWGPSCYYFGTYYPKTYLLSNNSWVRVVGVHSLGFFCEFRCNFAAARRVVEI